MKVTTFNMATAVVTVLGAAALAAPAAEAQEDYPSRTIEVIHEYGPGGGTDRFIRAVGQPFAEITGEQLVPISVQGGGGVPAYTNFVQRRADGYSLLGLGPAQVIGHIQGRMDLDELMPLARVQYDQALLWVPADSEYETLDDFLAAAQENPGRVTVGVTGAAGFDDVVVGLLGLESDTQITTVPFSSSEMVSNTLGGQVSAMFEEYGPARGLAESGDMRALAVFAEERIDALPDVPTAAELGYDVTLGRWRAFAMHADDDPEQAQTLYDIIEEAVATESYQTFEAQNALQYRSELIGLDEFQAFVDEEIETYTTVLRELGYIQ